MPLISFVVPAYRVQGYLRECLDSLLDQRFTDIEVVAVDDGSPDGSGAIIDEYAARDPRVKALHLPVNQGLGEARNQGLDRATGTYVWFLDGDDRLADDVLPTVARRLRASRCDVLLVDHVRVAWDGTTTPSAMSRILPVPPGTGVFRARDRPEVLQLLHTAWNRVVRRRFLVDLGLRFGPGWYEDVSFSYPVLLAAERIGVLERVCVHYRQRRHGAITRTTSLRHFDVFTHWRRVYELMDLLGPAVDPLRPLVFDRMIWHYLAVLGSGRRVPAGHHRAFFERMVAEYRRRLPADDYPASPGVAGVKQRLVAAGRWRVFAVLRALHRSRRAITVGITRLTGSPASAGAVREAARRSVRRALRPGRFGRDTALRGYYLAQLRRPVDETLALYAAYWYRGYACNPAAIYEKARELVPEIRGVWVIRRDLIGSLPAGVPYVVAGTPAYYRALAQAKWLINNVNFPDFVVKRPGTVHLQTHHGTPLKVMGLDQHRFPAGAPGLDFRRLLHRVDRWDYSVSANPYTSERWERAYPGDYLNLEYGYPRNDRLVTATEAQVRAARQRLGIAPGERVVLYAPTHREYLPGYRPPFDPYALLDVLGPGSRVLLRGHYFDQLPWPVGHHPESRVRDVGAHPVVEELYLAADVLITDYSSVMFDYAILDRPIVIYAPDWTDYRSMRGVYFDITTEGPGAVTTEFPDLLDLFRAGAQIDPAAERARARFRHRYCSVEDGRAAERVVRRVLLGEDGVSGSARNFVG